MKNIKRKYLLYLIPGILSLVLVIFLVTYAIWRVSTPQNSTNIISTIDCVNVSITGNNVALTLNNAYPMTNKEGQASTPYRFTVKNNCNTNIEYQIVMSVLNTTTLLNKEYVKVDIDGLKSNRAKTLSNLPENTISGLTGYLNNYTLVSNSLGSNESHVYNFRMWLNGDDENIWNENNINNLKFNVKLSIVAVAQTEPMDTLKN